MSTGVGVELEWSNESKHKRREGEAIPKERGGGTS